jgi:hypothetical protein
MRKHWWVFFLVALAVAVGGWTNQPKDGHNIDNYTLTFDVMTIGATEVAIAIECEKMILKAASANSGEIHIGKTGVLTTDSGFELDDRDQVTIDSYNAASVLYAIGTVAGQELHYICFN